MERVMCNVERKKQKSETNKKEYIFDFEKLEVYKMGIQFVRTIFKMTANLPKEYVFSLGEQIKRAALSIVNNIAEGSGKISKKEKAKFYRIALSSARECIPMLTILKEEQVITMQIHEELREKGLHISNMLGRLVASLTKAGDKQ